MTMKVIVIDDKPLIRRAIVETLDWSLMGCEVVASAEDGVAGAAAIEEHDPDLIITDIRMPGMDGLQLAEFAIARRSDCKVIVITGYQDFNYAKQCVHLGVFDYIVKPIDNEELASTVIKAVTELNRERQAQLQQIMLLPSAKKQGIADILMGRPTSGISEQLKATSYAIFVVRDGAHSWFEQEEHPVHSSDLPQEIRTVLEENAPGERVEIYPIEIRHDFIHVYMFKDGQCEEEIIQRFRGMGERLEKLFDVLDRGRYRYEWCPPVQSVDGIRGQYVETARKLQTYFFNRSSEQVSDQVKLSLLHDLDQFTLMLGTATPEEVDGQVDTLLDRIRSYASGSVAVAKVLISELCLTIAKFYYKQAGYEWGLGKSVNEILAEVHRLGNTDQAAGYIRDMLEALRKRQQGQASTYSAIVRKILSYIQERYHEELALNVVAQHFHLSQGHVSRLLRKETGLSFVDIVTRTRLEAAKRLMLDPTKRIQEVSESVGFKNYTYFYQVFKRYENISPQEYKNNL